MGKLVLSFAFVIVCSFPLSAQIDSGSKHYLTDFRLTINETTYSFVDSYMINVRADTSLVRRRSYRYGFSTNDLNAIYFRDGSHVLLGLAIGGGLGIAVGTWIFMELAGGGGGHPGIYFPPVLIAVPLGLLVTGLGTGIGALYPRYQEFRLTSNNKSKELNEILKKWRSEHSRE